VAQHQIAVTLQVETVATVGRGQVFVALQSFAGRQGVLGAGVRTAQQHQRCHEQSPGLAMLFHEVSPNAYHYELPVYRDDSYFNKLPSTQHEQIDAIATRVTSITVLQYLRKPNH